MKKIYFVRHGQSTGNAGSMRGKHSDPLNEVGRQQAVSIAGRLKKLPIQLLVASTMARAQETGAIISDDLKLPLVSSELFIEALPPTSIRGIPRDSKENQEYIRAYFENFGVPGWKHSDEESFFELKQRALEALAYLQDKSEEHMAVVTHGFFLKILAAVVVYGGEVTAHECRQFTIALDTENTGLTVFTYDDDPNIVWPWRIWIWNDHAHLAD